MNNKNTRLPSFTSNYSKNEVYQTSPNIKRSRTKDNMIEYKINKEIKLQPEEFAKNLKRGLSKHELTSEVYIPKHIPLNKTYNKDLLIDKVKNYESYVLDKKYIKSKLSNANSNFSKIYNYIKEVEGKKNRQQQYYDDIERIYLENNYNLKNCGIKPGDNMFNYSILIDKFFGDNIKQDAIRLINEIKDNKEIRREPKIIFKINNELIEQKLQKNMNNRNKSLIKKLTAKNDYGIDVIKKIKNKKYMKNIYLKNYKKYKFKKDNLLKKNSKIILEEDDNFLNRQLKLNLIKIQDNLENINNEFNNSSDDKENIMNINLFNKHFNTESNYRPIEISKMEKNNELIKDNNIDYFSNTNINIKNNINKNNKKSIITKLPKINRSFEEIKNLNLSSSTTTNCSADKNNKNLNLNLNNINTQINNNNSERKKIFNIKNDYTENHQKKIFSEKKFETPKKLNNLKNIKNKMTKNNKNSILSFLKMFLIGNNDKRIITEKELNYYISKFQEKNSHLFQSFRKQKIKISNLHGFASNFQRVTEGRDFSNLHEKNKYLKKNNYSNLISSHIEINDENDVISVHDIDKRISNIYYDSADFILNDMRNKKIYK